MKLDRAKIVIVGCGAMGSALIKGLNAKRVGNCRYTVITPHEDSTYALRETGVGIDWYKKLSSIPKSYTPDIIVFAVKPNVLDKILPEYKKFVNESITLISIAAGKKLAFYQKHLGKKAAVVRVMPNLPAAYNQGISVAMANDNVNKLQLFTAHHLLKALGEDVWIEDERLFDAVTAISGCGPAYLFLLTECIAKAGQKVGLPQAMAEKLARYTIIGAGALLEHSDEPASILKQRVASPGGVTEVALKVLENTESGIAPVMTMAIKVAMERSREMG